MIVISIKKLESEFKNELIEIPAKYLSDHEYYFSEKIIPVLSSSVKNKNGISLNLRIKATQLYNCDRCLNIYNNKLDANYDFIFEYKNQEKERIEFSTLDEDGNINLTSKIIEIINLAEPMKKLCMEMCNGLCHICGKDLNSKNCDCRNNDSKFIIKK